MSSFAVAVGNDEQPPVQHLAPIFSIIARSRVISSILPPIHLAMLPVKYVLGLPRRRFPCTFASTTHFTSSNPSSLIAWPKKESVLFTTNPSSWLVLYTCSCRQMYSGLLLFLLCPFCTYRQVQFAFTNIIYRHLVSMTIVTTTKIIKKICIQSTIIC